MVPPQYAGQAGRAGHVGVLGGVREGVRDGVRNGVRDGVRDGVHKGRLGVRVVSA